MTDAQTQALTADLRAIVNTHSLELLSNTPDYVLADYLIACIITWNATCAAREYFSRKIPVTSIVYGYATQEMEAAMFEQIYLPTNCTRDLATDLASFPLRCTNDGSTAV